MNKYKKTEAELEQDMDPLDEENRAIVLMDDPFNGQDTEAELLESADGRDMGEEIRPSEKILTNDDNVPSGMEDTVRGQDGEEFERKGEDLETGDDGGDHRHRHAESI